MIRKVMMSFVISLFLLTLFACTPADEGTRLPSEATADVQKQLRARNNEIKTNEQYYAIRKELAEVALADVKTRKLENKETFDYANLLSWAEKKDEASEVYQKLTRGDDKYAREAAKALMYVEVPEVKDNPERFEELIIEYRNRFKPTPEDAFGLYSQVAGLSYYYRNNGETDKAVQVILDEVNSLDTSGPYYSYNLLTSEAFMQAGKKDEVTGLLEKHVAEYAKIVVDRNQNIPAEEEAAETYNKETKAYEGVVKGLQAGLTKIKVTDAEAPGFTFTHFYNSDPFKWEDLKGKVILVDFWATWCGPCIGTFPELREFHAKYKDKGVFVLGVTGFQGSMSNHGKDRVTDISQEEELALMPEFIKHQNVTWPLAFSTRNCYDPEYGIRGIPTTVIIDKQGIVRLFTHPANKDKIIELVDKLLAE